MEKGLDIKIEELLNGKCYLEYDESTGEFVYQVGKPYGYTGVSDSSLKEMFESKYSARDWIGDAISDYEAQSKEFLISELMQEFQDIENFEEYEEEIQEYLQEKVRCDAPLSYLWGEKVTTQIVLQVEDEANSEFTLNEVVDDELLDGSIKWLINQQGYTEEDFLKLWNGEESELKDNAFLKSIVQELENVTTSTNKLTILTKMELCDIVEWNDFLDSDIKTDDVLIIPKNIVIGLVDTWNGAGSCIEIALEKELRVPIKNIYSVKPDAAYKHSIDSVYGLLESSWSDEEIKLPTNTREILFKVI